MTETVFLAMVVSFFLSFCVPNIHKKVFCRLMFRVAKIEE
jgi:hypothetical protein